MRKTRMHAEMEQLVLNEIANAGSRGSNLNDRFFDPAQCN
jgi:hypothetical protein